MKSNVWIVLIILLHVVDLGQNKEDEDDDGKGVDKALIEDSASESEEDDRYNAANVQTSYIGQAFQNKRTFACPKIKDVFQTGTSTADLSPEDIAIIGAMGDAISTGVGLWPNTDIEFRGAVFTVGGDANIDGLVTFANILDEFSPKLEGVSHGMGTSDILPPYQFNVAETGATTEDMFSQATSLVTRIMNQYQPKELSVKWVMIVITIGTEELCGKCAEPNMDMLRRAIVTLRRGLPKALVVLIGPVYVAKNSALTFNLLKPRCSCLSRLSDSRLSKLQRAWKDSFIRLEEEFTARRYQHFAFLTLPYLSISSRRPEQLFISEKPMLNRKGHMYAAKWLWNRLISGPRYNISVPLSEDTYYCPAMGCPYFRTPANLLHCNVFTKSEYARLYETTTAETSVTRNYRLERMQQYIIWWILPTIACATASVLFFGTIFYCHGIKSAKSRYENAPGV